MIHNALKSGGGAMSPYHPTSFSVSSDGKTATLSGITQRPTGVFYTGGNGSKYIGQYITTPDGSVIRNSVYGTNALGQPNFFSMTGVYDSVGQTFTLSADSNMYSTPFNQYLSVNYFYIF